MLGLMLDRKGWAASWGSWCYHLSPAARSAFQPVLYLHEKQQPALPVGTRAQVLWLHDCLAIWRSVHFLGHIAMLAIILLGNVVPPRRVRRELQPERAGVCATAVAAAAATEQAAVAATAGDGVAKAAAAVGGKEEKKEL